MATGRVEVITRAERRRRWSPADKLRLVMAMGEPGATVASVAREHGGSESLLYAWRGRVRPSGMVASPGVTAAGGVVPVAVEDLRSVATVGFVGGWRPPAGAATGGRRPH